MLKRTLIILSFLFSIISNAQINENLKKELDEILFLDQKLRALFDNNISENKKDSILSELNIPKEEFKTKNWGLVIEQDSINLKKIEKIISKYGYPGKTLVGEKTNESAWYVIQHSNSIEKYFPIIKKAGDDNEISKKLVAMMEDRLLMDKGKKQIYGTQIRGEKLNGEYINFVWPIKNRKKVNERRKTLGINYTIEEYAKLFDIEYKVFTLNDVKKIRKGTYKKQIKKLQTK